MNAVIGGGGALPFLVEVLLPALQSPACIEHPPEESLLPLYDRAVQAARLQPLSQVFGLVRQLPGAGKLPLPSQPFQLLGQSPLPGGKTLQLLLHRGAACHREKAGALAPQATLLLGQLRHSLGKGSQQLDLDDLLVLSKRLEIKAKRIKACDSQFDIMPNGAHPEQSGWDN